MARPRREKTLSAQGLGLLDSCDIPWAKPQLGTAMTTIVIVDASKAGTALLN
jgi:hypothetical protein